MIALCAAIIIVFILLSAMQSFYLNWNFKDPEMAAAGTILHGFEFLFVRLEPVLFITALVGIVLTYRGERKQ